MCISLSSHLFLILLLNALSPYLHSTLSFISHFSLSFSSLSHFSLPLLSAVFTDLFFNCLLDARLLLIYPLSLSLSLSLILSFHSFFLSLLSLLLLCPLATK